ncbi:MAG: dockerin type I repeat-containing protein, partial [Prevotellaceae bacterium]|nr:dockerin type I repeat-containing protein [Prevotellaceae bacterium]
MKKFYMLLSLMFAMAITMTVNAQKYRLSEEAAIPEPGVTYAIMNGEYNTFMSCKYGANGGLLSNLEDDDVLWKIEATGEKTEAGFDLYYIFSVGQQKYVQEVDLEGNPGLDGFDVFAYNGFNFELGDKDGAAKVTIERGVPVSEDVAENEAWRTNGPSNGFVIGRQAVVTKPDGNPWFMKFGVQNVNVAFEPYNERVAWQFWTVEKLGPKDELEALVENYSTTEFVAGSDPGYYKESEVEAYESSLQAAMLLILNDATDEEYSAAIADLRAKREAVEKALLSISDGYYFMVSGFDDFLNNFGVEKAAYGNPITGLLSYKTFDPTNIDFVFYVEKGPDTDEYWVQDYSTGMYVAKGSVWYNSPAVMTSSKAEPQNIRQYVSGKWYWGSRTFHNTSYTPYASSNPVASDSEGTLTTWGQWSDDSTVGTHFNLWYMRRVSDEQMAGFVLLKEQAMRTKSIEELATEGNNLYAKLFNYKVDEANPLITKLAGGAGESPVPESQIFFSTIRQQGIATADRYEFLADGDSSTYMQGAGYIQVDISATPSQIVTFEYNVRRGTDKHNTWGKQERPNNVDIFAAKDTVNGGNWVKIANTEMGALEVPARYTVDLGEQYSYLRYAVNTNANNGTYFTISEFQVYNSIVDETTSQYYTVEGLAAKADAMKAMIAEKLANAETATDDDIAQLSAAIAAVEESYADTLVLSELVEDCIYLASTVKFGEGVGLCNDTEAPAALLTAANEAKAFIDASVSVVDLKAAIDKLKAAQSAFLATIKDIESDTKFYYIVNASEGEWAGMPMTTNLPTTSLTSGTFRVKCGVGDEDYSSYSTHLYRFLATYKGTYYVQNMATGAYLPEFDTTDGVVNASFKPAEYYVEYAGNGAYIFTSANALNSKYCPLGILKSDTISHMSEDNETILWSIVEPTEEVEAIVSTRIQYNSKGIVTFPFNLSSMDINEDFHIYGVRDMQQTEGADGELETTISFYEKQTAERGEPVYYIWGDPEAEPETRELLVPMPTELTDLSGIENGLVGTLYSKAFGAGVAYYVGKEVKVSTTSTTIPYQLGVIDPAFFTDQIDEEEAFSITLKGLNKISSGETGDVNGDGEINSSDVVYIYNAISGEGAGEGADVNGDGEINSSDVVAVY